MEYAVIMAGGSGQRLWPLSRRSRPKQLITLFQEKSLLQHCVTRISPMFDAEHILVVTNLDYADCVREHLPELPGENILGEPAGRDTANAIGLAAVALNRRNPEARMAVFTADHIIEPAEPLLEAVRVSLEFLAQQPEALITFGVKATQAHTGFGYLKRAEAPAEGHETIYPVAAFKEKPNKSTARKYLRSGDYCWNSGMFVWRVATILEHLQHRLPHNFDRLTRIAAAEGTAEYHEVLGREFPELEKISIDYAVMERADQVFMYELDCHWADVGSYRQLAESVGSTDDDQNVMGPDTTTAWLESRGNIAISETPDHLIAGIGIDNLVVVHTDDATLICQRDDTDRLKELLENISKTNHERYL